MRLDAARGAHLNSSVGLFMRFNRSKIEIKKSAMSIFKPATAVFVVLLVSAAAYAQSSSDLRSKYGTPSEAYEVRPNVLMTVVFGADDQACEMVIEARHTSKAGVDGNSLIPLPIAEAVLSEVASMDKRGKGGRAITFSGGCSSITSEEYENVSIYRAEQCLQGGGKAVVSIHIKWKHRQCESKGCDYIYCTAQQFIRADCPIACFSSIFLAS
jgi:hypothetical protein